MARLCVFMWIVYAAVALRQPLFFGEGFISCHHPHDFGPSLRDFGEGTREPRRGERMLGRFEM